VLASCEGKGGVSRPERTLTKNDCGVRFVVERKEIWGRGEKEKRGGM